MKSKETQIGQNSSNRPVLSYGMRYPCNTVTWWRQWTGHAGIYWSVLILLLVASLWLGVGISNRHCLWYPRGGKKEIVGVCIQRSSLWKHVNVLHLSENMCLDPNDPQSVEFLKVAH